jgi:hypothetical protein
MKEVMLGIRTERQTGAQSGPGKWVGGRFFSLFEFDFFCCCCHCRQNKSMKSDEAGALAVCPVPPVGPSCTLLSLPIRLFFLK